MFRHRALHDSVPEADVVVLSDERTGDEQATEADVEPPTILPKLDSA